MPGFSSVGRACDCSRLAICLLLLKGGCGYHNVGGSNPPTRTHKHRWFNGKISACQAGAPGSIPGRCNYIILLCIRNNNILKIYK